MRPEISWTDNTSTAESTWADKAPVLGRRVGGSSAFSPAGTTPSCGLFWPASAWSPSILASTIRGPTSLKQFQLLFSEERYAAGPDLPPALRVMGPYTWRVRMENWQWWLHLPWGHGGFVFDFGAISGLIMTWGAFTRWLGSGHCYTWWVATLFWLAWCPRIGNYRRTGGCCDSSTGHGCSLWCWCFCWVMTRSDHWVTWKELLVAHHGQILRVAPEQLRRATEEEKILIQSPQSELLGVKDMIEGDTFKGPTSHTIYPPTDLALVGLFELSNRLLHPPDAYTGVTLGRAARTLRSAWSSCISNIARCAAIRMAWDRVRARFAGTLGLLPNTCWWAVFPYDWTDWTIWFFTWACSTHSSHSSLVDGENSAIVRHTLVLTNLHGVRRDLLASLLLQLWVWLRSLGSQDIVETAHPDWSGLDPSPVLSVDRRCEPSAVRTNCAGIRMSRFDEMTASADSCFHGTLRSRPKKKSMRMPTLQILHINACHFIKLSDTRRLGRQGHVWPDLWSAKGTGMLPGKL